jgi:hypothetical protein
VICMQVLLSMLQKHLPFSQVCIIYIDHMRTS